MSKVELKRKETPMGGNNFDAARSAANDMFNRMDKVSTTEEQSAAQKPDVFTQANEGEQKKTANLQDMSIEQLRALGNAAKQSNDTKMMDLITAELERRIAAKASAPATTETAPTVKRTTTSFEVTRDSRTLKITSSTDDLKKAHNAEYLFFSATGRQYNR